MRSTLSSSETIKSMRNNILPPGITRHTEIDADGYFAYGIAVYVPSVSERTRKVIREMDHPQDVPEPTQNVEPKPERKLEMKRGPSGVVNQNLE